MAQRKRTVTNVNYSHEMTRKGFCLPRQLLMEFRELVVFPTGLSESEVIRSLLVRSIQEEKKYKTVQNGNGNGTTTDPNTGAELSFNNEPTTILPINGSCLNSGVYKTRKGSAKKSAIYFPKD